MTPEERFDRIEQQIEFLAGHQAQMAAAIDRHSEQIGQLGDFLLRLSRFAEEFAHETAERFHRTDEQLDRLTKAQRQTEEELKRLAESQRRTDERLNVLINVVERYFSGNGKS
ncbi:MAG: hypothetical protein HY644_00500 [Acidobacteria bacterium]|nr:hypothetical protein [Acidobacteriota bacterium]